jgi:2-(3-amino-3-carboxypropyl)histidine synthase
LASPPSTDGYNGCSFGPFELNLDDAFELIRRSGVSRVGLQVPEGLKRAAVNIAKQIKEKTGAEVVISGDPCYGACDIDMALCQEVGIMLHLGHVEMGDGPDNVIFLEARMTVDLRKAAKRAVPYLRSKKVGVATTVQHVHKLGQAIEVLKEHGIEGLMGPAGGRIKYPGQVLGCCYSTAKELEVDEFLFIGTGQFHPLGIALATGKRVVAADPISGEVSEIDPEPMLRRRFGAISRAMDAQRFAILVSKKPGQKRMELAGRMKALGEAKGKEMFLIYLDNIESDRLLNLGADAAVSTACPRIALDDTAKYRMPILTPLEFEVLIGERNWQNYIFDEME